MEAQKNQKQTAGIPPTLSKQLCPKYNKVCYDVCHQVLQVLWHWNLFPAENQPIINTENATNPLQRSAGQGDNPWGG